MGRLWVSRIFTAIEHYLPEFMDFYFPEANAQIDWSKEYVFLDQELRAVVQDAELVMPPSLRSPRFRQRYREITSHLVAVFWQQSGVACGFLRGTGMAGFILWGGSVPCTKRLILDITKSTA